MKVKNPNSFRYPLIVTGILLMAIALGFAFQNDWVISWWPWADSRLSYIFVGSIIAAASTAVLWIGWSGEWGALAGGALNILLIALGSAGYLLVLYSQRGQMLLLIYGIISVLVAVASGVAFVWASRIPLRDVRSMPRLVRISFGIFATALLLASLALIIRVPTIFPWSLNPDSSVIFGLIFVGNASYFIYGLLKPRWHFARGQLLSFLAYDLVLIIPFLNHFAAVRPEHALSLISYIAVLVYSGALAVYFLFFNPPTKRWGIESGG